MFNKTPQQRGRIIIDLLRADVYGPKQRDKINTLLQKGANLAGFAGEEHALTLAIQQNHKDLIHYCITQRIVLDGKGINGQTALFYALSYNKSELARRLINAGVDVYQRDSSDRTALMRALMIADVVTALSLIKKGLSLQDVTKYGFGCANAAIISNKVELIDFVIKAGVRLDTVDGFGYDCLAQAIRRGSLVMVQRLLAAGVQPDFKTRLGDIKNHLTLAKEQGPQFYKLIAAFQTPPIEKQIIKATSDVAWQLVSETEVAVIRPADTLPYHVTEIFNFATGIYTRINRNIKTGAESSAMLDFSHITNPHLLHEATVHLQRLGGQAAEGQEASKPRSLLTKPATKEIPSCS